MSVDNHSLNIHFVFSNFKYPYLMFLKGVAYNIQQTLEGEGFWSSNFLIRDPTGKIVQSYWSPAKAMLFFLAGLLLYSIILTIGCLIAGYAISRMKGLLIALVSLFAPGIISVFGYWPNINFLPKIYYIGSIGSLGSPNGMAALLIISLISGWTILVIATDIFSWQDRFRHIYDHLWYVIAIIAAGWFFVTNEGTSLDKKDLRDATKHVQQASAYLLGQVREYEKYCKSSNMTNRVSCVWANSVQQYLVDYSTYDSHLYGMVGPKSTKDLYTAFGNEDVDEEITIRSELKRFNQLQCPSSSNRMSIPFGICQRPPDEFCTGTSNYDYMLRTVAVSNECVVPTLVKLRAVMEKQVKLVEADEHSKAARWLFYIFVAFLSGGKVANATAKLTKTGLMGKGLGDNKNTCHLITCLLRLLKVVVNSARLLALKIYCLFKRVDTPQKGDQS